MLLRLLLFYFQVSFFDYNKLQNSGLVPFVATPLKGRFEVFTVVFPLILAPVGPIA